MKKKQGGESVVGFKHLRLDVSETSSDATDGSGHDSEASKNNSLRHCVFRENKNRVFMFYLADSRQTMMDLLGTETT